jgi:hypothetical protein
MKFLANCRRNPGDGKLLGKEKLLSELKFKIFKFNNRPKPQDIKRILIVSCFSEFGCESIGLHYCIPKVISCNPGAYVICVGWHGRDYLYRHLVDEYWEIEEDAMFLRECTNAFVSTSRNISRLELALPNHGMLFKGESLGGLCVQNTCQICKKVFGADDCSDPCPYCGSFQVEWGYLADVFHHRKFIVQVPRPSLKMLEKANSYLKPNSVGIFARSRVMYGRNLSIDFYINLIKFLEDRGYNPIWLGEKQSVYPCPVDHIVDFSRLPESSNLELTLAIIANLKFTVQFWTASTRFASMMGTPWILFESPDQIVGNGQEGKRIILTTDNEKKKLVLSNFFTVVENQDKTLDFLGRAIDEINENNWEDIIGLVEDPATVTQMLQKMKNWRCM